MKKNCKRQIKQSQGEKVIKEVMNYILSKKSIIIHLIFGQIKKITSDKMNYFSEPNTRNRNKIKVELDLPNHATKSDLKNATAVDTSDFSKKADLARLKSDDDNLYMTS